MTEIHGQQESVIRRSASIWRRISHRKRPEERGPFAGAKGPNGVRGRDTTTSRSSSDGSIDPTQHAPQPRKLQKRTIEPIRMLARKTGITHVERIDVPCHKGPEPYLKVHIPRGTSLSIPYIEDHAPYAGPPATTVCDANVPYRKHEKQYSNSSLSNTPPPTPPRLSSIGQTTQTPPRTTPSRGTPTSLPSPPETPRSRIRVIPSSLPNLRTFPQNATHIHMARWHIALTPSQAYSLISGHDPNLPTNLNSPLVPTDHNTNAWSIYAIGPDNSGRVKVHFHRSITGLKIAELLVVLDMHGEGAGNIVGIKWDGGEATNWMSEEEAKYMVGMTCAWVLGVRLQVDGAGMSF